MIRWPAGSFVCVGTDVAPFLVILTEQQLRAFREMEALSARRADGFRRQVYATAFGVGVEHAFPATSAEGMTELATAYVGPHQVLTRGMCAAVALGEPLNRARDITEGEPPLAGGQPAPLVPKGPKSGGPAPAFFADDEVEIEARVRA